MKHICITIGMAMILILPFTAQAGQASPSILADACAACHGSDGKSPSTIPSIQGKSLDYMVQRLMAFKSGKREGTVMNRIAKGYSDAEIAAIAKYLASK
ncbi:MAG: hypothetical protein ETSY1_08520 [Candidatus Entotheonella factor]|uniref:Cytochrome c domain-containing protein n=1 Tax=Entotheonella factor TaxID=1429438 RepID=W4LTU3_ENTF1|nr:MAG: hypothetical protein ETSY1_08520 [Candidatus Entotheonella factor]